MRDGASSDPEQHLNGAGAAINGAYGGSTLEVVENSDWGWDHHSLCPDLCQEPTPAPLALALLPSGVKVLVLGRGRAQT